jgi:hypothetical protein
MRGQDKWITVRYIAPTETALPAALINTQANAPPAEQLRGRSPGPVLERFDVLYIDAQSERLQRRPARERSEVLDLVLAKGGATNAPSIAGLRTIKRRQSA